MVVLVVVLLLLALLMMMCALLAGLLVSCHGEQHQQSSAGPSRAPLRCAELS
jgi:hypothetical protein